MNTPQILIAVSIAVLVIVAQLVFSQARRGNENRLTPLVSLAFGFVVVGVIFGDNRAIGYSLMAVGVSLSVINMFRRSKSV